MEPFDKEAALKRISTDPECLNIFDKFSEKGASQKLIEQLKKALVAIPWEWEKISNESVENTTNRRKLLASKIREVCSMMESDPDANRLRVVDAKSIATDTFVKLENWPYVHDYFRDIAEHVENLPISTDRKAWEELKPGRGSKKLPNVVHYAKRRVFYYLDRMPNIDRHPCKETATVINVMFDLPPEEQLNGGHISKLIENERKKSHSV